jgi:voltage-gated potassium channel Kch
MRALAADLALIAAATAGYFFVPVPGPMRVSSLATVFGCGVAALGVLIALAVRRLLTAGENARIRTLLLLLVLTVLFFSWSDAAVGRLPGQFAGLHTRIDGLYFTIATLATVGFGDVHATGQLARAAVTIQVIFNLIFLSTAAAMITGFVRERARSRVGASQSGDDGNGGGEATASGGQNG